METEPLSDPSATSVRFTDVLRWSVVCPVHNQADHLERVVRGYLAVLAEAGETFELILVPNGCRDESDEICRRFAKAHSQVRLAGSTGRGWGNAVLDGVAIARGESICYTNLARTSPQDLVRILDAARRDPGSLVKARRLVRELRRRRIGSMLYNLQCRTLFGLRVADVNGTPKVFPRAFAAYLTREDDLIDLEFVVAVHHRGGRIIEVPVTSTTRHGGASTTGWRSALRMYWGALLMRRGIGSVRG